MPDPADDSLQGLIRQAVDLGADDEQLARIVRSELGADARDLLEQVIVMALDGWRRSPQQVRCQRRWLRRAAESGQLWALWKAGDRWAEIGSHASRTQPKSASPAPWTESESEAETAETSAGAKPAKDDALFQQWVAAEAPVFAEEARQWLRQAADRGHRLAALSLVRLEVDPSRDKEWLLVAYGDGQAPQEDQQMVDAGALLPQVVASLMASKLGRLGDPAAEEWFSRALDHPRWEEFADPGESWLATARRFARWLHDHGRIEECQEWSLRVVADAAAHGPSDRATLVEEAHKPYRIDYGMASVAEWVRRSAMRHLITAHQLPGDQALEVVRVLSDNAHFGAEDRGVVDDALVAVHGGNVRLGALIGGLDPIAESLQQPVQPWHAEELARWLVGWALPEMFLLAGLPEEAAQLRTAIEESTRKESAWTLHPAHSDEEWELALLTDLAIGLHPTLSGHEAWESLRQHQGWGNDLSPRERSELRKARWRFDELIDEYVSAVFQDSGLGAVRSVFPEAGLEQQSAEWRLMRRRDAWLAMWLACAQIDRNHRWRRDWEASSELLARAVAGVLRRRAVESGVDVFSEPAKVRAALRPTATAAADRLRSGLSRFVFEASMR